MAKFIAFVARLTQQDADKLKSLAQPSTVRALGLLNLIVAVVLFGRL
ncbi:MAG: hypothetical protein HRT35_02190 [Algicola sp.]|nr:hypothetical protein [Algicola sp.]